MILKKKKTLMKYVLTSDGRHKALDTSYCEVK